MLIGIARFVCLSVLTIAMIAAADVPVTHTAVLMLAEDEYLTETTVPAFAIKHLLPRGIANVVVQAEPHGSNDFPTLEKVLPNADVLLISVRRRTPTTAQLALIRAHLTAGKPIIGIRTASHAFALRKGEPPDGHAQWPEFDRDILGGSYTNHFGNEAAVLTFAEGAAGHPVLRGVDPAQLPTKRLYKNLTLGAQTTALLVGHTAASSEAQFVAWCNQVGKSRIFYTSLGAPDDFALPAFNRLLTNAVLWSLGREAEIVTN